MICRKYVEFGIHNQDKLSFLLSRNNCMYNMDLQTFFLASAFIYLFCSIILAALLKRNNRRAMYKILLNI